MYDLTASVCPLSHQVSSHHLCLPSLSPGVVSPPLFALSLTRCRLTTSVCPLSHQVNFTNDQTQEYQYYELLYRAGRPGVIQTIELVTPVRQVVPYTVTLKNPLAYPITFSASCSVSEMMMPSQLQVPPESEVREVTGHLRIQSVRHSDTHSDGHSDTQSDTQSDTHSLTHPLTHSDTQTLTHTLTHSLTRSLTRILTVTLIETFAE